MSDKDQTPTPAPAPEGYNQHRAGNNPNFLGRENSPPEYFDEDEGIPSVNRRSNSNKLLTAVGYVVFGLLGLGAIVFVNKSPPAPVERADTATVGSRLPPLGLPADFPSTPPAPPPAPTASKVAQGAVEEAEDEILARKMKGNLVQSGGSNNAGSSGTPSNGAGATPTGDPYQDRLQYLATLSQGTESTDKPLIQAQAASQGGGLNDLGYKLKPTVTEAVKATVLPHRDYILAKGAALDCVLKTAVNSSVAGLTTCTLTRDVYSDNGKVVLLDRGSQLVGEYQGALQQGQARMFLLWTRVKTPSGVVVSLDSPSTDSLGRAGLGGHIDNHFWERFGAAIMTSMVTDSLNILVNNRSSRGNNGNGFTLNSYSNTVDAGAEIVESMLETQANIPPTLIVNQGARVQILVARDLDFSGVYGLRSTQ